MVVDRSRYGLFVSALGAIVLAVSVFLPWYGVSFTVGGLALAQHIGHLVDGLGGGSLPGYVGLHAGLGALAGQQVMAVSAHRVLGDLNLILLVLAGLAILDALLALTRTGAPVPGGAGGSVVLLGAVATACVLYRMIVPPTPAGQMLALSVREGAWLALLGSVTIVLGGIWPRCVHASGTGEARTPGAWPGLSAWTAER
jgi:hypothetical protein